MKSNGKTVLSAMIWQLRNGQSLIVWLTLITGLVLSGVIYFLGNKLIVMTGQAESILYLRLGLIVSIIFGCVYLLNLPFNGEWQERADRQRELDKRFGRLSNKALKKRYGQSEQINIPLGRLGQPDHKLTVNGVDTHLIGVHHEANKGHTIFIAPTQSGKGLQLTKALEQWPYGAVVVDPKGEQYSRLVGRVKYCANIPAVSVRLDKLYGLDVPTFTPAVSNNLRVLYENLVRPDGKAGDAFWYKMGEPLLRACWKYAKVHKVNPIRLFFDMARSRPADALPALYEVAPEEVNQFAGSLDKIESNRMLMSGWQTLVSRLSPYQDMIEVIAPSKGSKRIPIDDLAKFSDEQKRILFITFDFPTMEAQSGLVAAILAGITMNHQRNGNKRPLLMAIDELPTVAPMRLPRDLATLTSYGVRYLLYVQNIPQLVEVYGEAGKDNLLGNCRHQVFYSPNDRQTARAMSEIAGQTIHVSKSYGDRLQDNDTYVSATSSRGERVDTALNPSEALRMDDTKVLVQLDGQFIAYANRINIIPSLKAGMYGNTPPPKQKWTTQRKMWDWTRPKPTPKAKGKKKSKNVPPKVQSETKRRKPKVSDNDFF